MYTTISTISLGTAWVLPASPGRDSLEIRFFNRNCIAKRACMAAEVRVAGCIYSAVQYAQHLLVGFLPFISVFRAVYRPFIDRFSPFLRFSETDGPCIAC